MAYEHDAKFLIRGLRNPSDYIYEENIAKVNKELNHHINTIYLRSDDEIISSSFVRECYKYRPYQARRYVSKFVWKVMEEQK